MVDVGALTWTVLGLLLAIPFGILADKLGRRVMLIASLLGLALSSGWVLFVCMSKLSAHPQEVTDIEHALQVGLGFLSSSLGCRPPSSYSVEDRRWALLFC